jgi:NADPH:quinone reductase-like Zn-dependent oxidoreductase
MGMLEIQLTKISTEPATALSLNDVPMPTPGLGEVRVQLLARPINPADLLLIEGRHVFSPTLPCPVGIEGAGVVDAVGEGVVVPVGTRVAVPSGGTWRDYMIAPAADVIPLPEGLSMEQGAMLAVNPFTAAGLLQGLKFGDWFIMNAASSSLAKIVLVLAKMRGLNGIAVVRSLRQQDELLHLGAKAVLLDGPELVKHAKQLSSASICRGLDALSGEASGRLFQCLAPSGELIIYGLMAADLVVLPAALVVFSDIVVRGFSRLRSIQAMAPEERQAIAMEMLALVSMDLLPMAVEARYPLQETILALEHHLRLGRTGKIILTSA